MNGFVRFALGLANMTQAEIDDLDAKLPGMTRLAARAKELEPILQAAEPHIEALAPLLQQAQPHIEALTPLALQALPILKAAYPDFVSVLPTIQEFIQFVNDKKGTTQ